MTLRNRVDPWSHLHAVPTRAATRMGNRGILHNGAREVFRYWRNKAWICCATRFQGIRRRVFQVEPTLSYSELFFLDEATALAAGHRPCNDCQRDRLLAFKEAWSRAHGLGRQDLPLKVSAIDAQLHSERLNKSRTKVSLAETLRSLPAGTLVAKGDIAALVTRQGLRRWSFEGYKEPIDAGSTDFEILTPPSTVSVLRMGYVPDLHPTAEA